MLSIVFLRTVNVEVNGYPKPAQITCHLTTTTIIPPRALQTIKREHLSITLHRRCLQTKIRTLVRTWPHTRASSTVLRLRSTFDRKGTHYQYISRY